MNFIGHREFGLNSIPFVYSEGSVDWFLEYDKNCINYWIKQWIETYSWLLNISSQEIKNIEFICYEKLCSDPNNYKNLAEFLGVKNIGIEFQSANIECSKYKQKIPLKLKKIAYHIYQKLKQKAF